MQIERQRRMTVARKKCRYFWLIVEAKTPKTLKTQHQFKVKMKN